MAEVEQRPYGPALSHQHRAHLPFRNPLVVGNLFGHLVATAVPGVEEWRDGAYRRSVRLAGGPAILALRPPAGSGSMTAPATIDCQVHLSDPADRPAALALARFLLDLDTDPAPIIDRLRADPVLRPLVDAAPGRRVPRAVGGAEFAVRAVLGQQISTAAARTHAGRLVQAAGDPIDDPAGGLTHLFPTPPQLATLGPDVFALPQSRKRALTGLIRALAAGDVVIDPAGDPAAIRAGLLALPGIGPWTVESVAARALGDPDAFLPTDLGVVAAAAGLGLPKSPGALTAHAAAWQPFRAYAVQYLWATGTHEVNHLPAAGPARSHQAQSRPAQSHPPSQPTRTRR